MLLAMVDFDVLVLGGAGVDTIVRVPELAVPPGDHLAVGPVRPVDLVGQFDLAGRLTEETDGVGDKTAFAYDGAGDQLTKTVTTAGSAS